jgi:hypothetical protein
MTAARRTVLTALATLMAMPAIAAERIITVEPGLWEYSHNLTIPGLLAPFGQPQNECISPEEAQRKLSELLSELAMGDAKCTVSDLKDTLNTVKFNIACRPELEGLKITSSGKAAFKYSRTNISGNVSGMININDGEPIFVVGEGRAHRVGRCQE